jgi:hypothetical protein
MKKADLKIALKDLNYRLIVDYRYWVSYFQKSNIPFVYRPCFALHSSGVPIAAAFYLLDMGIMVYKKQESEHADQINIKILTEYAGFPTLVVGSKFSKDQEFVLLTPNKFRHGEVSAKKVTLFPTACGRRFLTKQELKLWKLENGGLYKDVSRAISEVSYYQESDAWWHVVRLTDDQTDNSDAPEKKSFKICAFQEALNPEQGKSQDEIPKMWESLIKGQLREALICRAWETFFDEIGIDAIVDYDLDGIKADRLQSMRFEIPNGDATAYLFSKPFKSDYKYVYQDRYHWARWAAEIKLSETLDGAKIKRIWVKKGVPRVIEDVSFVTSPHKSFLSVEECKRRGASVKKELDRVEYAFGKARAFLAEYQLK